MRISKSSDFDLEKLGGLRDSLTVDSLVQALASRLELHGARLAAERLTNEFGQQIEWEPGAAKKRI